METIPARRDALVEARRDDNGHLMIDLSALTLMDPADLHALFEALDKHNVGGVVTSQP
jgi:anti-anti-sigma regulatory factor